jgi:hypothetical protein
MKELSDKEVLQKAIGMAEDNDENYYDEDALSTLSALSPIATELEFRGIALSHDFAKAFWGEGYDDEITEIVQYPMGSEEMYVIKWMYHLQQMVLEENPINYLRKFI